MFSYMFTWAFSPGSTSRVLVDMSGTETFFFYFTQRKENRIFFFLLAKHHNLLLRLSERSETAKYVRKKNLAKQSEPDNSLNPSVAPLCLSQKFKFLTLAPKAPYLSDPDYFSFSRLLWPHSPTHTLLSSRRDCLLFLKHILPCSPLRYTFPGLPTMGGDPLCWASPFKTQLKFLFHQTVLNFHPAPTADHSLIISSLTNSHIHSFDNM